MSGYFLRTSLPVHEAYLAYYRSHEVDWDNKTSVRWFSYNGIGGGVVNIPSREITTSRRIVSNVRVKRGVGVVSCVFKPGYRKTFAEVAKAVGSVVTHFRDITYPAYDVPSVEVEDVEGDLSCYRRVSSSKDNCRPSALQRIQEPCRIYGLSATSDVLSVQWLSIDALAAFAPVPVEISRPLQI